jgi:predicted nucleic acid-binding protein
LVDSSAWIEYYRPSGRSDVARAVAEAIRSDQAYVNGIIHVEIVTFAPSPEAFEQLSSDFAAYRWLELGHADFRRAAELGASLRTHGITVPATDLIVAASAIGAGATLYHTDAHFDSIALHSNLTSVNVAKADPTGGT